MGAGTGEEVVISVSEEVKEIKLIISTMDECGGWNNCIAVADRHFDTAVWAAWRI